MKDTPRRRIVKAFSDFCQKNLAWGNITKKPPRIAYSYMGAGLLLKAADVKLGNKVDRYSASGLLSLPENEVSAALDRIEDFLSQATCETSRNTVLSAYGALRNNVADIRSEFSKKGNTRSQSAENPHYVAVSTLLQDYGINMEFSSFLRDSQKRYGNRNSDGRSIIRNFSELLNASPENVERCIANMRKHFEHHTNIATAADKTAVLQRFDTIMADIKTAATENYQNFLASKKNPTGKRR